MSRLVDPTICPDCRTPLATGAVCPACGLRLEGPLAESLWSAMVSADRLVEQLRAQSAAAAPPATTAPPGAAPTTLPHAPAAPPVVPPHRRVPALSVPVVLLSLGALCLLVAAVVFIAVTWNLLSLTGRTLVLVGFTALLAAIAVVLTRKNLRVAAETFWLIVAGMLVTDLLGAREAGLLGLDALSWRDASALVGGALLVLGAGVAVWARSQPVTRLYGVQVVAIGGAALVTVTNGWGAERPAVGTSLAVPMLVVFAWAGRRVVPLLAVGLASVAGVSWLVLLGIGWSRALELAEPTEWWSGLRGWPLLVAALMAALVSAAPDRVLRIAPWLRSVLAGAALVPLVVLVNAPRTADDTRTVLLVSAALVALAAVTAFAPRIWARAAGVLGAIGVVGVSATLLFLAVGLLSYLPDKGQITARLVVTDYPFAPWSTGVMGLAVALALASLVRLAPAAGAPASWRLVAVLAVGAFGLGASDLVLALEPPLWAAATALGVSTLLAVGATWAVRADVLAGVFGSTVAVTLGLLTLAAAQPNDVLSAVTATVLALVLVAAFAIRDLEAGTLSTAALGVVATWLGGYALTQWGEVIGADATARSLALAAYAALVALVAAPVTRRTVARVGLETAALVLVLISLEVAPDATTLAMDLTVVGSALALLSVLFRDRHALGWLGAAVLAVATFVRVVDGASAPELYALPAAALLLGGGLWRLRADREAGSFATLGSGLALALLPSLVLAMDEPVSLRGALVGAGGVLTLAFGVVRRLAAPFVLGAGTTAVLALRHLEPIAQAVPRWVSLGVVGLVLLAVGITWEARLRDLRTARRYLVGLR